MQEVQQAAAKQLSQERPMSLREGHLHSPQPNLPMLSASDAGTTFQWMALGSPGDFTFYG